ncbi:hypothetical protein ACT3TZ_15050 [Brachybacterium sp. AOP25-B2-12]|uniref:hypothetical protein n=1 Tax=Brachybacterium sp. AOP25-B2-12 TaxID=3457710 RepID=UPI004033540F
MRAPTFKTARRIGIALSVFAAILILVDWIGGSGPFDLANLLVIVAAAVAWVVCGYAWSQERSIGRE